MVVGRKGELLLWLPKGYLPKGSSSRFVGASGVLGGRVGLYTPPWGSEQGLCSLDVFSEGSAAAHAQDDTIVTGDDLLSQELGFVTSIPNLCVAIDTIKLKIAES